VAKPWLGHSQLQKIYLHPKANGSEKQSKFVDSLRFIPLDIIPGVELTAYAGIDKTKNYFLVKNYTAKTIIIYSKDGRFIKKINYKKLGEGLSLRYDEQAERLVFFGNNKNYTLTSRDELKIMLDWNNPKNLKYFRKYSIDLDDTTFSIHKETPGQHDIIHAYRFYDDYYWQGEITTSELYKDSLDYELKLYQKDKLVKGYFPYNAIHETRFLYTEENIGVNSTDTPYIHFITRPYCDTVYKMIYDSIFPAFQLVLPLENSLPPSFFTKPFRSKTDRENYRRNNGSMFRQVYNFYETPAFIYFSVGFLSNYESYIYQKQSKITYKAKNIRPDSSQYNLQLLGDYGFSRKGNRIYKTIKAGDLVTFFSQNKNTSVPKELENFLRSNPPATTPVIIEFKLNTQR
jgi:hypothetical protein